MGRYWSGVASARNPNGDDVPSWPAWDDRGKTLFLGVGSAFGEVANYSAARCAALFSGAGALAGRS